MRRASLRAATAAALLVGGTCTLAAPASHAAGNSGLIAAFTVTSSWNSGFEGGYTVTNRTNKTVATWSITFDLPAGEAVTSSWNGTVTHSGNHYTVTAPTWESPLAPGASAPVVGMDFSSGPTAVPPSGCLINTKPCDGVPADVAAPSVPTGLAVKATGPGSISLG